MKSRWFIRALIIPLALSSWTALGAASFWIPFSATPVTGTKGGKSGLFVISSSTVGSSPAPVPIWITTSEPTLLGAALAADAGVSPAPATLTPAVMIYAAEGSDAKLHLYGLDLANPSGSTKPPKPVQITSLSVAASEAICSVGQVEANATEPTTLSVVVHVATPMSGSKPGTEGYCAGVPSGKYYLAAYTASVSTAPTLLSIPGGTATFSAIENDGNFVPLNSKSGVLAGLYYWDSVTKDENFYSSAAFSKSTASLSGVESTPVACTNIGAVTNGGENLLAGDYLATVTTAKGAGSYEFTSSGSSHEFFAGQATGCVTDTANLYFIGTPAGSKTAAIYQETAASLTTAKSLLSGVGPTGTQSFSLVGSNGAVVILEEQFISTAGAITTTAKTVPVGVASKTAKTIGGPFSGGSYASFLAAPKGETSGDDWLFLSEIHEAVSGGKVTVSFASQALDPATGTTVLPSSTHSVWQSFGPFATEIQGSVLEITGITDTDGGFGGGSLDLVTVGSTGSPSKITLTGGGSYKVPASYLLSFIGFNGTSVASGILSSVKGEASMGAALNAATKVIVPLSLADTNVQPML